jgi:hypothetical protein
LDEAGAFVTDPLLPIEPDSVSWLRALVARSSIFGYLALFVIAIANSLRRRLLVVAVMISLAVGSSTLSWLTYRSMPNAVDTWFSSPVSLLPGAKLSYKVELSSSFLEVLRKEMEPQDQLQFLVAHPTVDDSGRSLIEITVAAGPVSIPIQNLAWKVPDLNPYANPSYRDWDGACWAVDLPSAVTSLTNTNLFTVDVTNHFHEAVTISAWQRRLPGRQLTITSAEGAEIEAPEMLPAIEIRLVRPDGSLKVVGF